MDTLEFVGLAIAAASFVVGAVGLYARRGDFAEYGLKRDKNALLQRAADRAQQVQSASMLVEVGFDLETEKERRAARALALEGRATMRGNSCWIAVDRAPVVFRRAMAAREHQWT